MLMIQGERGADVLAYSESLESVSFTSTSTEVLRGLGYWLFYIRDAFGATTTASLDHLASAQVIVAGVGLLAVVPARPRVHDVAAPPLRRAAGRLRPGARRRRAPDRRSVAADVAARRRRRGWARAGVAQQHPRGAGAVFGLALSAAALVAACQVDHDPGAPGALTSTVRHRARSLAVVIALWPSPTSRRCATVGSSTPNSNATRIRRRRGSTPRRTSTTLPAGYRVLQLPGGEFGAFRWGYTVDQPLPGAHRAAAADPRPAAARQPGGDGPRVRPRRPVPGRRGRRRRDRPDRPPARRRHDLGGRRRGLRPLPPRPPRDRRRPPDRRRSARTPACCRPSGSASRHRTIGADSESSTNSRSATPASVSRSPRCRSSVSTHRWRPSGRRTTSVVRVGQRRRARRRRRRRRDRRFGADPVQRLVRAVTRAAADACSDAVRTRRGRHRLEP